MATVFGRQAHVASADRHCGYASFSSAGGQAAAQEAIGAVSRIQGEAHGTRGGTTRALGLNAPVFLNETVSTGEAARLEVTFIDNTRLTSARRRN